MNRLKKNGIGKENAASLLRPDLEMDVRLCSEMAMKIALALDREIPKIRFSKMSKQDDAICKLIMHLNISVIVAMDPNGKLIKREADQHTDGIFLEGSRRAEVLTFAAIGLSVSPDASKEFMDGILQNWEESSLKSDGKFAREELPEFKLAMRTLLEIAKRVSLEN